MRRGKTNREWRVIEIVPVALEKKIHQVAALSAVLIGVLRGTGPGLRAPPAERGPPHAPRVVRAAHVGRGRRGRIQGVRQRWRIDSRRVGVQRRFRARRPNGVAEGGAGGPRVVAASQE